MAKMVAAFAILTESSQSKRKAFLSSANQAVKCSRRKPYVAAICSSVGELSAHRGHQQQKPPSTRRSTPVTKEAASERRKIAGPTISSTVPIRPIGVCSSNSFV